MGVVGEDVDVEAGLNGDGGGGTVCFGMIGMGDSVVWVGGIRGVGIGVGIWVG